MGVFTRRIIKEDLDKVNVFLEDTKNEIFVVQDLPETFGQGRTTFKIFGSNFLKDNVPLKIEILDKSGETVYVQPVKYGSVNPKLPYRYVSTEVYRDINVPGEAKLVILGELDPSVINVPQEFQGTYNVKFSKSINIDTFTFKNTQPILFYKKPTFTAQEIVSPRKKVNPQSNTFISGSQIFGKVKDDLRGNRFLFGYDVNSQENSNEGGKSESSTGDVRGEVDTYKYKTGLFGKKAILSKRGIKEERASEEPPQMRIFSNATTGPFTSKMVGGTIDIRNIQLTDAQKSELANLSQEDIVALGIDASEISNFFSTNGITENLPNYSAKIERVVSSTELVTSKPYSVFYNEGGDATERIYSDIGTSTLNANFTASFVDWEVPTTSSFHFDSFVDIDLKNLRTFSGDVYRVKVYGASDESTADFPVLLDTVVESPELLRDTTSPSGFLRSGYFKDQTHINKYWNGFAGNNTTAQFTSSYDSSLLIDGVLLSGSYAEPNEVGRFELDNTYSFTIKKDIPYTLTFRAKGKKTTKNNSDGTTTDSAKLLFHLSGSNLSGYDGKSTLTYASSFGSTITDELNRPVGLQIDDTNENKTNDYVDFGLVSHTFFPKFKLDKQTDTGATLQIRINSGMWVLSDVSLRPAQDTGFSPDEFSLRVPIPTGQNNQPNNFDFLVEYYDVDGNVAETATFINDVKISGSALIIQGTDNMITGSLFLGSLQGTGIEFHGGSAFIRAVGYQGFKSASAGQGGGFFMWSGSVAPGGETQDNYSGAGLEIHDGNTGTNESFLKFRTRDADYNNNSTLEIKTSKFFLGGQSQFVSGSDGNIEISSSNFHLQNDGDVVMQGTITVEAGGTIGGWDIGTNTISDVNAQGKGIIIKSDASSPTIAVTASGANSIELFHTTDSDFGIKGTSSGNTLFQLGSTNQIAGWTINNESFTGGNMIIQQDGTIKSSGFQEDLAGSGFKLTADNGGFLEVENARIRGTLKTAVFEKETVNAVGGELYIANSTVLTGSSINPGGVHAPTQNTMSVENASGFAQGEILRIKKVSPTGFNTEYVFVNSASRNDPSSDTDLSGNLFVTRSFGNGISGVSSSVGETAGVAVSYSGSQVIVSTGRYISGNAPNTVGSGYMRLNARPTDASTPFMDIAERTGSGVYDVELKTRLGDLSGVAGTRNVPSGFTGFGLMSEVAFLSGSNIILEAPSFLLGDKNSNFISGSNGNLSLTSQTLDLNTTSLRVSSSGGGTIALGSTAPTDLSSDGIFLTGSGDFNLQSGSSFIRGTSAGLEMNYPSFSVDTSGVITARGANINGTITAESGEIGSGSFRWEIDGDKIINSSDSSFSVEMNAGSGTEGFFLTSGSKTAQIVPEFTPSSEVLGGGGSNEFNFTGGTEGSTGQEITVNHDSSNTTAVRYAYNNGATTLAVATSDPNNGATLSSGTKYKSTLVLGLKSLVSLSNSGEVAGSYTVTGTVQLVNNDNSDAVIETHTISQTIPHDFVTIKNTTITVNTIHTPSSNHKYYWKLNALTVTNNNITEEYVSAGKTFTNDLNNTFDVFFKQSTHTPQNNLTEMAPGGFQAVFLSDGTLETSPNSYFRVDGNLNNQVDILGEATITGSLVVKARGSSPKTTIQGGTLTSTQTITGNKLVSSGEVQVSAGSGIEFDAVAKISHASSLLKFFAGDQTTLDMTLSDGGALSTRGDITAFGSSFPSDKRFKTNITPITNSLDKIKKLKGVEFDWYKEYDGKGHDIGFIAQEVREVGGLEPLVKESENLRLGDKSLNVSYSKLIPVLVEAIKEQQEQIDDLKKKLEES